MEYVLRQRFVDTAIRYGDHRLVDEYWKEIANAYSGKRRFYHNFSHLAHLHTELEQVGSFIRNWDAITFAIFYHDVIYNPLRSDNEEKSATLAASRLVTLHYPDEEINRCITIIQATKMHQQHKDNDINFFTDADLAILGSSSEIYNDYFKKIRNEYSWYPDFIYNPGRKKVLQHFLSMKSIFKTDFFSEKYEARARLNLRQELDFLSKKGGN